MYEKVVRPIKNLVVSETGDSVGVNVVSVVWTAVRIPVAIQIVSNVKEWLYLSWREFIWCQGGIL
jgi:hypothetical protein